MNRIQMLITAILITLTASIQLEMTYAQTDKMADNTNMQMLIATEP